MLTISHRGNTDGPSQSENDPAKIKTLLDLGVNVEIDVHCVYGGLYLGHDAPVYEVPSSFLAHPKLWCHAKNHEAMLRLLEIDAHCFGHDGDDFVVTTRGFIWCHPRMVERIKPYDGIRSIIVMPPADADTSLFHGVCTDYPKQYWK